MKQIVTKKVEKTPQKAVFKTNFKTTSLFLRYNKIRNIDNLLEITQHLLPSPQWEQLVWIDLSHNRLVNIAKQFQSFPQLKNLYLHVNFIYSFKEF